MVGCPMSKLLTLVAFVLLAYFLFSNRKRSYQVSAFSWKFASGIARRKGEECFGFEGDGDGTIERFDTILLVIARRSFPLLECDFYGRY